MEHVATAYTLHIAHIEKSPSLLLDNLTSWTPEDLVTDLQSWQLNKFAFSSSKEKLVRLPHSSFSSFFWYRVSQTKLGFIILLWK